MNVRVFRVGGALGLSFKHFGKNIIPILIMAVVLYAPAAAMILLSSADGPIDEALNRVLLWPSFAVQAAATLFSPMLTYRVIQDLNGKKVSMIESVQYGFRGILPAIILGAVTTVVQYIPFGGGIISSIITCTWFVAAAAAVAEKLDPFTALKRSAALTSGVRWPIFGLLFLVGLIFLGLQFAWIVPMISRGPDAGTFRTAGFVFCATVGVMQMFIGIVEAVSYVLLRQDKDGVSTEELARVFD